MAGGKDPGLITENNAKKGSGRSALLKSLCGCFGKHQNSRYEDATTSLAKVQSPSNVTDGKQQPEMSNEDLEDRSPLQHEQNFAPNIPITDDVVHGLPADQLAVRDTDDHRHPIWASEDVHDATFDTNNHRADSDALHASDVAHCRNGEKERRFIMLPGQLPLDSVAHGNERLLAPVLELRQDEESNDSEPPADNISRLAENDGCFRMVRIHYDGDEDGDRARVQHIMHDTGAGCSLTFESKLKNLGLRLAPTRMPSLTSVQGEKFQPIGTRQIFFSYYDFPEQIYNADLMVLRDPPEDRAPSFDILFGRDTIEQTKALKWDLSVIGVHHFTGPYGIVNQFPSLFARSPRASVRSRLSEDSLAQREQISLNESNIHAKVWPD